MAEEQFFLVEIDGQKWPVLEIPSARLTAQDRAAQPGASKVPILAAVKNKVYWIDPYELIPADTSALFDLCATADRHGNYDLRSACEQVEEHGKIDYWIAQYESYQLPVELQNQDGLCSPRGRAESACDEEEAEYECEMAIKLSKEKYQRQSFNDLAIAGPSGTKRTRSPIAGTNSDDDLYSSPSSAKKSRKDDKTLSTSSSGSSMTSKDDSQSSKSSPNMELTPTPAEVRRLREKVFMGQVSTSKKTKGDPEKSVDEPGRITKAPFTSMIDFSPANKARIFLDNQVDSTRFNRNGDGNDSVKKRTENLGPRPILGMTPPVGACAVAQEAGLIQTRERAKPTLKQLRITDFPKKKFSDLPSKPRRHYDSKIKEGAIAGHGTLSANGGRAKLRSEAIALLDSAHSPLAISGSSSNANWWSEEEDVELVKLRDQEIPSTTWEELAEIYNARMHTRPDHKDQSESSLWNRYNRIRTKWKQTATAQFGSMLDFVRNGGMEVMSKSKDVNSTISKTWTSAQDDELVKQEKLSNPATVIDVDDDDSSIPAPPMAPEKFSAEEDGELIILTEKMGKQTSWEVVVDEFNKSFPHSSWSMISLKSRYYGFLLNDRSRRTGNVGQRQRAIDALKQKGIDHPVDSSLSNSSSLATKKFSAEEDGEIIRLREKFHGLVRWDDICREYDAKFPDAPRSSSSLSTRYLKVLQKGALEQFQRGVNMRERGLAALRKRGIELQINDPISNFSSEEGEDDNDESEEEEDDDDDDELDNNGIQVTILIGEENKRFTVPLSRIETNRYFLDDEYEGPTGTHMIQGHRWKSIEPNEFLPIHEFILNGDFNPPLDATGSSLVGITTDSEHNAHILRCTQVFVIARRLLMWDLAALSIHKFKLLKREAVYLLKAADMVFCELASEQEVDAAMRALLVEEVVGRYWDLIYSQPTNMRELMGKNPLFAMALHKRMAETAGEGYKKLEGE